MEQGNPYYIVYRNCFFRGTDVLYYVPVGSGNQCEIPKGATGILRYAFANTYNLTLVEIPEGVKTIGDNAFYYSNVFTLELPASLETIGDAAFDKSFLNQITLDPESKNFVLLDEILYTKDKKELIVASGKEVCTVHVPEETEEIRSGAFQRKSFTAIQLPAGLKKLEKNALSNSHGKLSCKILFEGTEDAWIKIAPELTGLTVDDTIGQPGETGSAISGKSFPRQRVTARRKDFRRAGAAPFAAPSWRRRRAPASASISLRRATSHRPPVRRSDTAAERNVPSATRLCLRALRSRHWGMTR